MLRPRWAIIRSKGLTGRRRRQRLRRDPADLGEQRRHGHRARRTTRPASRGRPARASACPAATRPRCPSFWTAPRSIDAAPPPGGRFGEQALAAPVQLRQRGQRPGAAGLDQQPVIVIRAGQPRGHHARPPGGASARGRAGRRAQRRRQRAGADRRSRPSAACAQVGLPRSCWRSCSIIWRVLSECGFKTSVASKLRSAASGWSSSS